MIDDNKDSFSMCSYPTNDNSNPQQGTNRRSSPTSEVDNVVKLEMKPEANTRRNEVRNEVKQVKIPPTKKDGRKLFVGGIAGNVTDEDFRLFFEQFGVVIDSVVMFDKETRRSRGFGFVTFEDLAIAKSVLEMSQRNEKGIEIKGKACEVKAAEPKAHCHGARMSNSLSKSSCPLNGSRGSERENSRVSHRGARIDRFSSVPTQGNDMGGVGNFPASGCDMLDRYPDLGYVENPNPYIMYPTPHPVSFATYAHGAIPPGTMGTPELPLGLPAPFQVYGPNGMLYYPACFGYNPYLGVCSMNSPNSGATVVSASLPYESRDPSIDETIPPQPLPGENCPPVHGGMMPYPMPMIPVLPVPPGASPMQVPQHITVPAPEPELERPSDDENLEESGV